MAFEKAWQRLADRHAVFRTAFLGERAKEFVQAVRHQVQVPVTLADWRASSEQEQQ